MPFMAASVNAIRDKLTVLPNEARRLYYNTAGEVGGFAVVLILKVLVTIFKRKYDILIYHIIN